MSLRSAQEGRPSLGKVDAGPESLPEAKTEAQPLQAKVSSPDPAVVQGSPSTHTQQSKGPENRLPVPYEKQSLASRIAEAEAWETQAFEAEKRRSSQFRQGSVFELEDAPVKQRPSLKKVEVSEKEKREVVSPRPLWVNKAEYIFALVGFSLRPAHLWRFPLLWLHNGGCKSGDQESWDHRGLARQRLIQASNFKVSGICRGWRLGTLSRIGASCPNTEGGERGRGPGDLNIRVGLEACIRVVVETMYLGLPGIGGHGAGHLGL